MVSFIYNIVHTYFHKMKDILRRDIMVVHIKGRVVIICGPVSSGKSGLSRKIASAAPMNMGVVLPYTCMSKNGSKVLMEEKLKQQQAIGKAINKHEFVVIECEGVELEQLYALVISIRIMGYQGTIDMVKMVLPKILHFSFFNNNRNKKKISLERLKTERKAFKRVIEDEMTMNINEIKVVNPTEVTALSFEFEL